MKLKNVLTIGIGAILAVASACGVDAHAAHSHKGRPPMPGEELKQLNKAIKSAPLYMHDKQMYLDSLTMHYRKLPETDHRGRWLSALKVSEAYLPVRADSALYYSELSAQEASSLENPSLLLQSRIARINSLSTCGIFTRALEEFRSISPAEVPDSLKASYWSAGRKMYGYMRVYVEGDVQFFNEYTLRYFQYDDSLVGQLAADNPLRCFYIAERMISQGRYPEAKSHLEKLCTTQAEDSNLYAMAAYQMALVCKNEGDQTAYASYLAKAAISDIKGCVKDGLALPTLAEWLYRHGELNLAFRYINFALEDAMAGNVRMRTVTIAALLPLIDEAYREKINASRDELMVYFLLVTFLLLVSAGLVVILMRMIRRGRATARKLARTSELQESYIGHFIGLCSTYANRLQSLQKLVSRKLASGQADELQKLIKSGKFDDDQNEEFYKIFDSAFLDIYPDFIENINSLLRPEEALELKNAKELTPELRIYAFVRLGVDESTKIAQMLNYSVSTVYAYRNRMRNRAIDRENFDHDVMGLGRDKTTGEQ